MNTENNMDFAHILWNIDRLVIELRDLRRDVEQMYNKSMRIDNWQEANMSDIINPRDGAIATRTATILESIGCYDMRIMQFLHTVSHQKVLKVHGAGNAVIRYIKQIISYHTGYDWTTRLNRDLDPRFLALYKK